MSDKQTGAADWRSESEKRKSLLRKSVIALFKTWIPDHPEASMARGEVFGTTRDALGDFAESVTFVSLLSFGSEDMFAHDFLAQPLSMQDLLVQREGTDAFLDAKNALRVVRRKFGMMTLIARMASNFEQRNIVAVQIRSGFDQNELVNFAKAMAVRVEGTAAEEEIEFKRRLRQTPCEHFDVIYHSELIGRRIPVPWPVKEIYSFIGRQHKKTRNVTPEFLEDIAHRNSKRLGAKMLRQLSIHCEELAADLDAGGLDPYPIIVKAADERRMLTATRNIFDEFQALRRQRRQEHVDELTSEPEAQEPEPADNPDESTVKSNAAAQDTSDSEASVQVDAEDDFLADAEDESGTEHDSEFLLLAQALDRIRTVLGKAFFHRISMVSGDVNFVDAAMAGVAEDPGIASSVDPVEALKQARDVTEAFYRARALGNVVPTLLTAGRTADAVAAAEEALQSARACQNEDIIAAYTCAFPALIAVERHSTAAAAVEEALSRAHQVKSDESRASSLMRITSSLMEAGSLPPIVRRSLSRSILGDDVYFWGKSAIKPQLIEVILSLLSGIDDDTIIFLQKVVVHPDVSIRRSVLRTLPLDENEHIRNMLVSHLQDGEAAVRGEVIERIGGSGDSRLSSYLVNHYRQNAAQKEGEKRLLALNLARMDVARNMPIFNAMLGKLATKEDRYVKRFKPIKDDTGYQRAGLEVLYHLNSREARRLLFNAAEKGSGPGKALAHRVWRLVKNQPYGDATLPRSTHDPEYGEETTFNLDTALHEFEENNVVTEPPAQAEPAGLFGKLKSKLFSKSQAPKSVEPVPAPNTQMTQETSDVHQLDETVDLDPPNSSSVPEEQADESTALPPQQEPKPSALRQPKEIDEGPRRAGIRFEAMLTSSNRKWSGTLPMRFSIFDNPTGGSEIWSEKKEDVTVTAGRFEVVLGMDAMRLPGLPAKVWLAISVDGEDLEPRAEVSRYRSVIQG